MTNIQEITVAIDDKPPFEYIISKEGEADSRIIKVGFIENNIEYKIPANTTARIKIYKPDGNKILSDCTIADNKVVCTLSEQMLSTAGVGKGEILLYNNNSVLIGATFYIKIVESVYKNHTLISDNDYFSLNKIMIETIQVRESLENAYKIAETQGEKASEAADKANTAATAANKAASAANTATSAANTATTAAKTATTEAQTATAEANKATAAANKATADTTEALNTAQTALNTAQTAISNAQAAKATADTATAEANKATAAAKTATTEAQTATAEAKTATAAANKAATDTTTAISNAKTATAEATKQAEAAKKTTDEMRETVTEAKANATVYMSNVQTYVNNAKEYAAAAKTAADGISGALKPKGTVAFAQLPAIASVEAGSMYNISTEFTSTSLFKDGGNIIYPAGTNVYKTTDNFWDCLSGELSDYLMRADIDEAVEEAMPAYTASTELTELVTGESVKTAFGKLKTAVKNVITIAKLLGSTDISKVGNGTVTGAVSTLNTTATASKTLLGSTDISKIGGGTVTGAVSALNSDFNNIAQKIYAKDLEALTVDISNKTRLKISFATEHGFCLVFGEANHTAFCYIVTYTDCIELKGGRKTERFGNTWMVTLGNWATATIIRGSIAGMVVAVD
nr:MAG TPA: BppU domain protein [Caudoviricetes sp.]